MEGASGLWRTVLCPYPELVEIMTPESSAAVPPALADLLCFSLYSAQNALMRAYRMHLQPHGLTYPQFLVLEVLADGRPLRVGDICLRVGLDSSTLSPILKRLEAQGLLLRLRNARDERQVDVRLTDEGMRRGAAVHGLPARILPILGVDTEEAVQLRTVLQAIRNRLDAAAEEVAADRMVSPVATA